MKTIARIAGLCALGLLVAGCGTREPTIKIGFAAPLTGDQAPQGQDMLNGAKLAIDQVKAAGPVVAGFALELIPMDDQHSPTQSVAIAKRFAADPDALVIVGHLNSSCTMPASAVYHEARMLEISPVSSNPQISRQGFDTFYRTCATDDLQGPAAAIFAVRELGAKRIFLIDDMTTYGRGLANEFERKVRALGAEIIGHEGITQGDKDFSPLLTKVKSMAPELIYFAGMFPEGALLLKQRHDLGLSAHFMGSDGQYDPALIELAGPGPAEGIYLTAIGSDIHQVPTAKAFIEEYERRFGPVGAYSSYAYEAANIAVWAVQQAARQHPELFDAKVHASTAQRRLAVLEAMKTLKDYPGIFGPQNFDERGDSTIRDVGLFTVKDGKFAFLKTAAWE